MDAIKILIFSLLFPVLIFSQQSKYPKDTIYVKYENKVGLKKWNMKFKHEYENKKGIYFNIEHIKGDMALFYNKKQKPDTLCMKHLKDYTFENLKEIEKKEKKYYKKRFGGNPWIKNKNGVFHTFLIELISKEKFVVYPVIWRSQGVAE
jgi:hypothetical protein